MYSDLNGKVAMVTGAAMGIGKETALRLARDGCDVALVDLDKQGLEQSAHAVEALGRNALFCAVDISQWDQVQAMVARVLSACKRIDILVNSAGILGPSAPVWEYAIEDWDRVMAVDLRGTFLMCKAVVGAMRQQQSGRIVNLASIAGKEGNPMMCAYTAAKAAVIAFTRSLALEVVKDGIVANAISPTMIEGRIADSIPPEQKKNLLAKIPMGRLGKTEEVANLIRFLVSDQCTFSTGACYDITGGRAVY
jgi:3-oxoacyl-[acyl-carrier protein] reductase